MLLELQLCPQHRNVNSVRQAGRFSFTEAWPDVVILNVLASSLQFWFLQEYIREVDILNVYNI